MSQIEEYISNPDLVRAMKAVKDIDSKVTQNRMITELLQARLLIPVTLQELPEASEESGEKRGKILFHMIRNTAKQKFFLAFSSMDELKKWRDSPELKTAVLRFDDYAALVLDADSGAEGIAIDPLGENLIMTKQQVKILRREKRIREGGGIDLSAVYGVLR